MATRRKACCSACAAGRKCSGKPRRRVTPISRMSDAQLRQFTARDPRKLRGQAKKRWIGAKIRLLRHEEYGQRQAVAIAMNMAGVARPRTTTRRSPPRRRRPARRRR